MANQEKVITVIDGNTFETDTGMEPRRVANLFIPEPGGPCWKLAHRILKDLIKGRVLNIEPVFLDRDGALVAEVELDGTPLTKSMEDALEPHIQVIADRWDIIGFIESQVHATGTSVQSNGIDYRDWYIGHIDEAGITRQHIMKNHNVQDGDPWFAIDTRLADAMREAINYFIEVKGMRGCIADEKSHPKEVYGYFIQPHTKEP